MAHVRDLVEIARRAEDDGFDSAWVSDHLFHASYVAARLGSRPYHEPLTVLTAAAMATRRIALGTSVLVLPWHHPVRLAKAVASLDDLSDGRVILGVGVAETADEYASLGVDFRRRGVIADDTLGALRSLWTEDVPSFHGETLHIGGLRFEPKPVQRPHPPVWVGGAGAAAMRRLGRYGDGWHPLGLSPAMLAAGLPAARAAVASDGRETSGLRVAPRLVLEFRDEPWERPVEQRRTCRGTPEEMRALVRAHAAAGATDLVLDAASGDPPAAAETYARFAREVIPGI